MGNNWVFDIIGLRKVIQTNQANWAIGKIEKNGHNEKIGLTRALRVVNWVNWINLR